MLDSGKLNKLSRQRLHEQTYDELRSAIMSAKFAPGDRLTVRGIAAELGVSAMPVRAAFIRLTAEKAVIQNANGTIEIPRMTRKHYHELISLRALLEGKAAELAAKKVTKDDIALLREIGDRLTRSALGGDATAYVVANRQFKFAVVRMAESPALEDLVQRLWVQVGPFMGFYNTEVRAQADLDQHHQVIAALEARDGRKARKAIEKDIMDGLDYLFRMSPALKDD